MRAEAEGWEVRHGYGHSSVNFHDILRSLIMLRSPTLSDSAENGQHSKIIQVTRKVERPRKGERQHIGNKLS